MNEWLLREIESPTARFLAWKLIIALATQTGTKFVTQSEADTAPM
jgi:hypothetical protein